MSIRSGCGDALLLRFIVLLFFGLSATVNAQVIQGERFEIPMAPSEGRYEIAPAGDKGIFLYRTVMTKESNAMEIAFLDTAFQVKWNGYVPLPGNAVVRQVFFVDRMLVAVSQKPNSNNHDLQLYTIDYEKGEYVTHFVRNFIPLRITDFKATRYAAIIGGYFNHIPVVLHYGFTDRKAHVVPGLFNDNGDLTPVRTYPDGSFDVVVSTRNMERQQTMVVRNYDAAGALLKSVSLIPEENKYLIFGQSVKSADETQVVAGVYGGRNALYSKGIFVATIDRNAGQKIHYYSYADLENFFKYLRAGRERRIKERIARRKVKGRKTRFNYRLLVHELVPHNNEFIMLGEAFYPRYSYTNSGTGLTSYRGGPYTSARTFEGYFYTHAVVAAFDKSGRLKWDNSFQINDVRTFELEQFVKLDAQPNHISLLYLFDHQVRMKIISDNAVLRSNVAEPIRLSNEGDYTAKGDTESSKLEYWYPHHFYAYGIQKVSRGRLAAKRRVFFINKIRVGGQVNSLGAR